MIRIAIIVGSTRPGRKAEDVARRVLDIAAQVLLSLSDDLENYTEFKPRKRQEQAVTTLLCQVVSWSMGMQAVRERERATA